jgi:hypothetical protein
MDEKLPVSQRFSRFIKKNIVLVTMVPVVSSIILEI